jgi:hypothetical protein
MAAHSKSRLLFLLVLILISTINSFEPNKFLEDKNFFKNILKKRSLIEPKLAGKQKINENQKEKNLFLGVFPKKFKNAPPNNIPRPPQNEPAPPKSNPATPKNNSIINDNFKKAPLPDKINDPLFPKIKDIIKKNSIIDDDNMEKPLYIQDSFDNLFSNEKNLSKKFINVKCFWVNDFDIYSLEKLSTDKGYNVNEGENEALFSLCKNLKDKDTMFLLNNKTKAAGSIENYSKWDKNSDNLTILLPEGEICDETKKKNYTVKLIFECDDDDSADIDDEKENFENNLKLNVNGCEIEVTSKTVYACPLNNYYIFERIFKKYKIPSVIFICLMGLFLAFFGAKVLKVTVLLLGALVFCVIALSAVYSVFSISNENTMLIVMAVAFCIGLALGCLLLKLVKLFIVILGGACGYTLGLAVYAILKDKNLNIEEDHLYYGTLAVCIILCAMISLCLVKHVLIFGTSIIGGYLIIKGISLVLGHLPNESRIVDLIKKKEFDQLDEILKDDKALYYYLGWLIIVIIGVCVQYRNNKDEKKKNKLLK